MNDIHNKNVISHFVEWVNEASVEYYAKNYPTLTPTTFDVEYGNRYARIVEIQGHGGRSAHCFVETATLKVLKAESWSRPALGQRYDLADPASLALLKSKWTPSGGYLYAGTNR